MHFSFSGEPSVAAPRDAVWKRLLDPFFVAGSAPGVEAVRLVNASTFDVVAGLGAGAFRFRITMRVELLDLHEPERATLRAHGDAAGSEVRVKAQVNLVESAPGETTMRWSSTYQIQGGLVSVGGRFLEATVGRITAKFWQDFIRRVAAAAA